MHAALVHVQAYYCHASLGSRIKIDWKYYWYYPNKSFLATQHTIISLKSTTKSDLGSMDLVVCFIFTFSSLFCFLTHGTLLGTLEPIKNPWDLFRICGTSFEFESSAFAFVCFEMSTLLNLEISSFRRPEIKRKSRWFKHNVVNNSFLIV